jgi:ADP-ribose pyrophosphatase YjhB (NUDIX family)
MSWVLVWFIVQQDGAILLGHRKAESPPFAGKWTLPGDVMLDEEMPAETIERFAREQLDLAIKGNELRGVVQMTDPLNDYAVNVFDVGFEGHARFREGGPFEEMCWAKAIDVSDTSLDMPEPLRSLLLRVLAGIAP